MYRRFFVTSLCVCVCSCTLERPCDETEHFDIETQKCAKTQLDVNRCGYPEQNCKEIEGVDPDNVKCSPEGECLIMACTAGYHKTSDGLTCEEDTARACGNPDGRGPKNCIEQAGVKDAVCENGQCNIKACEDEYYLYESSTFTVCSKYSTLACGPAHVNCMTEGVMQAVCEDGKCIIKECADGFSHVTSTEPQFCNRNTNTSCGKDRINCIDPALGIESAKCENGACVTLSCINGYSLVSAEDGDTCVEDTAEACGVDRTNCNEEFQNAASTRCLDGVCHILSCTTGYSPDLENNVCVREDSPEACGPDSINCYDEHPHATEIFCKDDQCIVARCEDLYEVTNDNQCQKTEAEARLGEQMYTYESSDPLSIPSTPQKPDEKNCVEIDVNEPVVTDAEFSVQIGNSSSSYTLVTVNSTQKRCIHLKGSKTLGGFAITNLNDVDLDIILDGVTLTNLVLHTKTPNKGNLYTLFLKGKSTITTPTNNDKSTTRRTYYEYELSKKKALYSRTNLAIAGDGTLNVNARFKTGIYSADELSIFGGTINVTMDRKTAATASGYDDKGFAVKVVNGFNMIDGKLTINAHDQIKRFESRGIKVDGLAESVYNTNKGQIYIYGGELSIISDAKGMTAAWTPDDECSERCEEDDVVDEVCKQDCLDNQLNEAFYPDPSVIIYGGDINIQTVGDPRTDSDPLGKLSPEGLEAKNRLSISGGRLWIEAKEDGINAGADVAITGGQIYARSLHNDGIDSNNTIRVSSVMINGGATVMALGAKGTQGGIDGDDNMNITFAGGHIIAVGGNNNLPDGWGSDSRTYISVRPDEIIKGRTYVITKKGSPYVMMGVHLPNNLGDHDSLDDEPNSQTANHLLFIDSQIKKNEIYTLYEIPALGDKDSLYKLPEFASETKETDWLYATMLLIYTKVNTGSTTPGFRWCNLIAGQAESACEWGE